ncbi:hypothetical protein DL96DRAFT_1635847 [Flagelloscypha sp. PMI_526]|nr:hypothetical protein DL96DRAFT_1635847 [Flagelloscypha sp. PMI_526]
MHQAKLVNRVFYHTCRERVFRDLILVAGFTKENVEEQLQVLRKRLNRAKLHPTLIKSIRFMPNLVISDFYTWTPAQNKPFGFLRQFFRRAEENPAPWPARYPAPKDAPDIDEGLVLLLPTLTSLEELYMEDSWCGGWGPTADFALKLTASRLTILTLKFGSTTGLSNLFPSNQELVTIALPVLHTFRLCLLAGPTGDFKTQVQKLLFSSPLLQEVHYHFWKNCVQSNEPSYSMNTLTHPHLKAFKWSAALLSDASISLPPPFSSHSFQFDVVLLDPPPSLEIFSSLNMAKLVELRVDLHGCSSVADFFAAILGAEQLVVLEVLGFLPYDAASDPSNLLPGTGLGQMRELHLEIILPIFSVQSLRVLASKTTNNRKLVLLVEPPGRWTRTELREICEALLYEFHFSTANKSFSEWNLFDFGILFRHWTDQSVVRIKDLEGVLTAISRKVPSITSFYGTGSLNVWDEIENDMDMKWGGELWNAWEKQR